MTVKELKERLDDFPDELLVVIETSRDYEDYDEVTDLKNCNYTRFRGGHVKYSGNSNAVILA